MKLLAATLCIASLSVTGCATDDESNMGGYLADMKPSLNTSSSAQNPGDDATVTSTTYPPRSTAIDVNVSIRDSIYRQATVQNRAHLLNVDVTYDSAAATTETVSASVLVSATTFVANLPDQRSEVRVSVPLGTSPEPSGSPNFQSAVTLILAN